jgi:hypothetical protein
LPLCWVNGVLPQVLHAHDADGAQGPPNDARPARISRHARPLTARVILKLCWDAKAKAAGHSSIVLARVSRASVRFLRSWRGLQPRCSRCTAVAAGALAATIDSHPVTHAAGHSAGGSGWAKRLWQLCEWARVEMGSDGNEAGRRAPVMPVGIRAGRNT